MSPYSHLLYSKKRVSRVETVIINWRQIQRNKKTFPLFREKKWITFIDLWIAPWQWSSLLSSPIKVEELHFIQNNQKQKDLSLNQKLNLKNLLLFGHFLIFVLLCISWYTLQPSIQSSPGNVKCCLISEETLFIFLDLSCAFSLQCLWNSSFFWFSIRSRNWSCEFQGTKMNFNYTFIN